MTPIRTLLVDDEYLALNLLAGFLSQIPDIEVVDKCTSPIKALEVLNREPVDLLFLDIQMPLLSGTNLLKTLRNPPCTILTTAYSDYAVEAFELRVVDYLLKPFSLARLLQAVQRAREWQQRNPPTSPVAPAIPLPDDGPDFLTVKADGKILKIAFNEILFIEGLGEYVRIVCADRRVVVLQTLRHLEAILPPGQFLRTHKSYIVAIGCVSAIEGNQLEIGMHRVPVSRDKREEVISRIFDTN
jgi:two-component system, LytTR family, response regulator LytT